MLHIQDFEIDAAFSLKILKGNQIKNMEFMICVYFHRDVSEMNGNML